MRSRLLLGFGVGLIIGAMFLGGSVAPRDDRWIVKRATELGMVSAPVRSASVAEPQSLSRLQPRQVLPRVPQPEEQPKPQPQPAQPPATQPAPKSVPAAAPQPSPQPAPTPAPQPRQAPAPPPKPQPKPAPEPVHQEPSRRVTISENATLKEILGALQEAQVVQNADDRDQIMLELRSGRHFVPGNYVISPGQSLEETMKRITASSR